MPDTSITVDHCARCKKTGSDQTPLKKCAQCKKNHYCSKECQKTDWKIHKKFCCKDDASYQGKLPPMGDFFRAENIRTYASTSVRNLQGPIEKPFHHLKDRTWLHNRPEEDVYKLLIDAYRLRVEDTYVFQGDIEEGSLYDGRKSGRKGFVRFLLLAEGKPNLLPSWWSPAKRSECIAYGMRFDVWSSLMYPVEKKDLIGHYGDPLMPMQLRMFGEQICGAGPWNDLPGQGGTEAMLEQQMTRERGQYNFHLNLDMADLYKWRF